MSAQVGLIAWGVVAAAWAHGGLHQSTALEFGPDGPVLESSYGVIRQDPDGQWSWICEEVSGLAGDGWTFSVASDGRMWFTGIEGARTSADGCDWAELDGPTSDRFFTAIVPDPTRAGVVWATTGNGGGERNPVLRADDGGVAFVEAVEVDPTARLRSLGVAEDGRVWAQGMVDTTVWVWTSSDGDTWQGLPVVEVDRGAGLGDVGPDGSAWLITRASDGERLWRVTPELDTSLVFESPEAIDGVSAGPGSDEVWLGGRSLPLRGTLDGGDTWVEPEGAPSVGCLERHEGHRWVCADNWVDGAALARVRLGGEAGPWESVLWFGDVHRVADCAEETLTATECEPLWADLDPESGMDLEPRDDDEGDSGFAPTDPDGCCAADGKDTSAAVLLPLLALGWGLRRRQDWPGR